MALVSRSSVKKLHGTAQSGSPIARSVAEHLILSPISAFFVLLMIVSTFLVGIGFLMFSSRLNLRWFWKNVSSQNPECFDTILSKLPGNGSEEDYSCRRNVDENKVNTNKFIFFTPPSKRTTSLSENIMNLMEL